MEYIVKIEGYDVGRKLFRRKLFFFDRNDASNRLAIVIFNFHIFCSNVLAETPLGDGHTSSYSPPLPLRRDNDPRS